MASDVFYSMFHDALGVLDSDESSPSERFAAEEALSAFIRVLADDERCITDLLAYVRRAIPRRRDRCRRFYLAAAALRAISNPERAFATACRVMNWAAAAEDDDSVAYLLKFYLAT